MDWWTWLKFSTIRIYSVGVWNKFPGNWEKYVLALEFTPLEFETQKQEISSEILLLEFTPLEFETKIGL